MSSRAGVQALRRRAAPALLAAASLAVAGCGDDSALLRQSDAEGLKDTLVQVRGAVDDRKCSVATARLAELRAQVVNLTPPVDRRLRRRLREEVDNKLGPAVRAECDDPKTERVPTTTTPSPTGPTGPVEPEPEPAPEPTESVETTPPTDTAETIPAPTDSTPTVPSVPEDPTQDPGGFGEGEDGDG